MRDIVAYIYMILNVIAVGSYLVYLLVQNKLNQNVRVWILRVILVLAILFLILGNLDLLQDSKNVSKAIGLFFILSVMANITFTERWNCKSCGKKMGLKLLLHNRCPYCGEKTTGRS